MTTSEKMARFEATLKSINGDKRFASENGEKLLAKLSDRPLNVNTISSGSLVLDQILGGGLAQGRIIEIYGPESSGKTSIALTAVGNVQRDGGTAVFVDTENALDPKYAAKLGVNLPDLAVAQPGNAEQALQLIIDLTNSGVVDVIVLDSVAALVPEAELNGDAGDHTIGLVARLLSKNLRKLVKPANDMKTTIIFINQTRDAIGQFSPMGTPTTTTGGKALKFYASQRIEVRKGMPIKGDKADEKIGVEVKFKIVKNKVAPPFGTGISVLSFNKGINVPAEMMEVGPKYGIIARPNNRTYLDASTGEVIGKSKAEALERLETDEVLMERLSEALKLKISSDLYGQGDTPAKTAEPAEEAPEE